MGSIISFRSIRKVYPSGVLALDDVSVDVRQGQIHSVIGENGAGKSTLMKILYGLEDLTDGNLLLDGNEVEFSTPADAVENGIGMVHQEFMLIPSYTVTENVILGCEPYKKLSLVDYENASAQVASLINQYDMALKPDDIVSSLPVVAQQKVEILKLLFRKARILIMDEPTAVLTPQETLVLFDQLKEMKEQGCTILFVSHKLNEVLTLSDTISVMRKGKLVITQKNENLTDRDLATQIVGRPVLFNVEKGPAKIGGEALRVTQVSTTSGKKVNLSDISFSVRNGEVLGVAGIDGNGKHELVQAITGQLPISQGKIFFGETEVQDLPFHERRPFISFIHQNRKEDSSCQDASMIDNVSMGPHNHDPSLTKGRFFLSRIEKRKLTNKIIQDFQVVTRRPDDNISTLSGGNQQKLILGREFSLDAPFILLDQPTRGLDVGSIEYIHKEIIKKRDEGRGVLLLSSELEELLSVSDRIIVLYEGRLVGTLDAESTTAIEVGRFMLGMGRSDA